MNKDQAGETILGAIVTFVAVGFLLFALARGGEARTSGGYPLYAKFNNVGGLAVGSDVRLSGVKVGAVSALTLDPETYQAKLTLSVDQKIQVPIDSIAKVTSDGILGGSHLAIEPGGAVEMLPKGGEFEQTQGSVDLFTVLASMIQSGQNSNTSGAQSGGGSEGPVP